VINIVQGVSIVARMLDKYWHKKVLVYYDPDPDGIFSGHAVHEFLTRYNKPHEVYINQNRGHGILFDDKRYADYLVINVDSGVSWNRLKELVDNGVNVISIDHHEVEGSPDFSCNNLSLLTTDEVELVQSGLLYYHNDKLGTEGVVINNQYPFEPDEYRFMSGCGVVLDVLHQLDPSFNDYEHIAWHGVTLLSDSREIENPIAFEILKQTYGIDISKTKTIKHITDTVGFNKFEIGEDMLDRAYIDFYLSPFINAMLRLNKGYEAIRWFSGETLQDTTVKDQQKAILEELKSRTVIAELQNILLVNVEKYSTDYFEASNFIGLLANKLLTGGKTVVITCTHNGEFERGSVRGYYNSIDYRKIFEQAGLIALGHKGAFGLKSYKMDYNFWVELDKRIGEEESKSESTYTIHTMSDVSQNRKLLKDLAYQNQFLRPIYKHYIKYTGLKCFPTVITDSYQEYSINGMPLRCFDKDVNIRNGHILPTMSKGYVSLYLERITV
jgi:single-stranded-DNA-specific exonuclease